MLAPLTKITFNRRKCRWNKIKQDDFDEIKRILARDTLLKLSGFNETFKIHNDDSDFQLGAVISQKGKPIALYSKKNTEAQTRYTVK